MTKYTQVISQGGNQYKVTIGDEIRMIDLDGVTVMTDEDYKKLKEAGLADETTMWTPSDMQDEFELEVINYAINYSGFDADEYIKENK